MRGSDDYDGTNQMNCETSLEQLIIRMLSSGRTGDNILSNWSLLLFINKNYYSLIRF